MALCGWLISRLRFDTDITNLMPKHDPTLNAYLETLESFGTFDYLLITVAIPEGQAHDPYGAFVDALAARLKVLPELETVEHRIDEPEKLLESFFPKAFLFLDEPARAEIAAKLTP